MRIGIVSDLHIEFGDIDLVNHDNIDVLILGGDICVAEDMYRHPAHREPHVDIGSNHRQMGAQRSRQFFRNCSQRFPHVIYLMGNHEHYHGQWERTEKILREELADLPNITLLEQGNIIIDGVMFIGATLWTDLNKGDPITEWQVKQGMNDYRVILVAKEEYRKLRPADTRYVHQTSIQYIRRAISSAPGPVVVCTHHAPSPMSIHPRYNAEYHMNGGYVSDLSQFILNNPQIVLWTHGHTHDPYDYKVGDTRVVCNPRGYLGYERGYDEVYLAKVVEI